MATNKFTFTTPINLAGLHAAKIVATGPGDNEIKINEDQQFMLVTLQLQGSSLPYDNLFVLRITNSLCDSLQFPPSPTTILGAVASVPITVANAFTQCLAAYKAAGDARSNLLTEMGTLGIIPPGA